MSKPTLRAISAILIALTACKKHDPPTKNTTLQTIPSFTSHGVELASLVVADDFNSVIEGNGSAMTVDDLAIMAQIDIVTTAKQYEHDFNANEIAADGKYHSKKVLIYGTISSIQKDVFGEGYFTLDSMSPLGVQAHLDSEALARAALAKKGNKVALKCTAGMRIAGVATLDSCLYLSQYLIKSHITPEEQTQAFFSGRAALPVRVALGAVMGYALANSPITPDSCKAHPTALSCDVTKWRLSKTESEQLSKELEDQMDTLKRGSHIKRVSCADQSKELPGTGPLEESTCILLM